MAEHTNQIAALLVPVAHLSALARLYGEQSFTLHKCDQPGRFVFPDGTELEPMDVYGTVHNEVAEEYHDKEAPPPA